MVPPKKGKTKEGKRERRQNLKPLNTDPLNKVPREGDATDNRDIEILERLHEMGKREVPLGVTSVRKGAWSIPGPFSYTAKCVPNFKPGLTT